MPTFANLPPRRALFVREYLKDLNGRQAAIRAGYAAKHAVEEASRLLADTEVRAAVNAALAERFAEVKAEAVEVVRDLLQVVRADPNDLVQSRRGCCRHCWGEGYRYQRTQREMDRDRAAHAADMVKRQAEADALQKTFTPTAFDQAGGLGYHAHREPNAECPECFGDGVLDVHVADSRLLSGPARRLYAGIKQTKDGIEVRMRDQDKALEMLGRHLGMWNDKLAIKGELDLRSASDDELRAELAALTAGAASGDADCPLA